MAKKPAKKNAKTLGKKQMKKTAGGLTPFGGGIRVASGDVNGDGSDTIGVKLTPSRDL